MAKTKKETVSSRRCSASLWPCAFCMPVVCSSRSSRAAYASSCNQSQLKVLPSSSVAVEGKAYKCVIQLGILRGNFRKSCRWCCCYFQKLWWWLPQGLWTPRPSDSGLAACWSYPWLFSPLVTLRPMLLPARARMPRCGHWESQTCSSVVST